MLEVVLNHFDSMAFRIHRGSLLLHERADRASSVRLGVPVAGGRTATSLTYTTDRGLLRLLLWELCDSIAEGWTSTNEEDLPLLVGSRNVWVISFYPIRRAAAELIDAQLAGLAGYFGVVEIDAGHPLQRDLLWTSLIYDVYFDRGALMLVHGIDLPEERYMLDRGDEWWGSVDFTAVGWHEERARNFPEPPDLPEAAASKRGRWAAERVATRSAPSHLERVVSHLAGHMGEGGEPVALQATLPGASHVVVEPGKLTGYVLNPNHERGRNKARLFDQHLAITAADWPFLLWQLRHGIRTAQVHRVRSESFGVKYHAYMAVIGRNGAVLPVLTAWIVEPGALPRLTSAYVTSDVDVADLHPPDQPPLLNPPPTTAADWSRLYELADSRGRVAAATTVPAPMFVGRRGYAEGEIGHSTVTVRDARRGFARWLIAKGLARPGYRGGAEFGAPRDLGQSAERAAAYAEVFAQVLDLNGVACGVHHRLD
jgi:uncharacterized protein DUF6883